MLVSLVGDKDPIKTFDGYTNKQETEKKLITQVFVKNDKAFLTGNAKKMIYFLKLFFNN